MFCSGCNSSLAGVVGAFCPRCGAQIAVLHDPYSQNPHGQSPYEQNPHGQSPYGQNPQGYYGHDPYGYGRLQKLGNFATASLVLGIIGLVAWFLPIIGFPVTIVGLVLGIKGMKSAKRDRAIAGVVMSIIGLALTIINSVAGAVLGALGLLF